MPRGGWFRLEERPYPERLDRAFRALAVAAGLGAAAALAGIVAAYGTKPLNSATDYAWAASALLMVGALDPPSASRTPLIRSC